jgi:hypothetical protein
MKKKEETLLNKSPGTIRWASYGVLCYIAWFAKRAVHMLTNCYLPIADSVNDPSTVLHWFTEKGEKVQRKIERPLRLTLKTSIPKDIIIDGCDPDEETDDIDDDDAIEDTSLLGDDVELVDVEGKDITHFNPDLWKVNMPPDK